MNVELAKRAVACKAWRWMPGMLALGIAHPGLRLVEINDNGDALMEPRDGGGPRWWPDLDDLATLGCLLALVREAAEAESHRIVEQAREDNRERVSIDPNGEPVLVRPEVPRPVNDALVRALTHWAMTDPEADRIAVAALVAALEAANV